MQVKDEFDYQTLRTAEELLGKEFNWNIKDDEMTGWVNEDEIEIIANLCDLIERLKGVDNG